MTTETRYDRGAAGFLFPQTQTSALFLKEIADTELHYKNALVLREILGTNTCFTGIII